MNNSYGYAEQDIKNFSVNPIVVRLYVPPITWRGDPVGHIGTNDVFFWVIRGECYLMIDDNCYIVKPGQLAFLPKGLMRTYTHISENFLMYEMAFSVKLNDENLFDVLDLSSRNHVVDIADREGMSFLFEDSLRHELYKNLLYDIGWCANIVNMIKCYVAERTRLDVSGDSFDGILKYMSQNLSKNVLVGELAALVFMQPTYFIKKFKEAFGKSPMAYFNMLRIYKSMSLLVATDYPIEQIALEVGINDKAYFSRIFKKHCNITPSDYRKLFHKQ